MIRLCAACRKTSVRRTTGTLPEAMTSANTCPGPTDGSWSISPMIKSAASSGTAFISACSDDRATGQFQIEGRAGQLRRHLEQSFGERNQLFGRQSAMALVHGLGQGKGDARAHPDHGSLLDAEFDGDGVGGLEADTADVARQPEGVLGHDLHGVGTIRLIDTHRPRCADTVLM